MAFRFSIWFLFLLLSGLAFNGCMRTMTEKPPGPWYEAYQPIEDVEAERFLYRALEKAVKWFGEPAIPVNRIILRRSKKTAAAASYRISEDFSCTTCVDVQNGIFAIYVGADVEEPGFYPLLAHEAAHLLNAHVTDWYMEGLATVFSEQVCAENGKTWETLKLRFSRLRRSPYAAAYRMMRALQRAFPQEYKTLPQFAVPSGKKAPWMRIDIDAWIGTLPKKRKQEALKIIRLHAPLLRRWTNQQYSFTTPLN